MLRQRDLKPIQHDNRFRLLFEKSGDASLLLDGNVIIDCNDAAVKIMGCQSKEQLLSLHPSDLSPEYQPDGQLSGVKEKQVIAKAIESGSLRFEWLHRRLDGQVLPAEVLLTAISVDGKPIVHSVVRDVTERIQATQRLEEEVRERTREIERQRQAEAARRQELQTLLEITAAANSSLDLDAMLDATLARLVDLLNVSRAAVLLPEPDSETLSVRVIRPQQAVPPALLAAMIQTSDKAMNRQKLCHNKAKEPGVFLPLQRNDQVLGVLDIVGPAGSTFSPEKIALFVAIADQLALALEQSRLYEQVEEVAAAAERSRLARDLHDSVTQTLFSASLIAEVLPRIWRQNQQKAMTHLEDLRQLTRGALAEMRTLLLELRPDTLGEASLSDLLRQLTEAVTGRARVPITLNFEGERPLPPDLKVALYRIAQEALNNVAKHAKASQVQVLVRYESKRVTMSIRDDGRGFDPAQISPDCLGMNIMYERATTALASIKVDSQLGQGTHILVTWTE